jgi:transaldolase
MKFFIDTANLAQIKEANDLGILDGVTTNPSLMAKEGIFTEEAVLNHYKTICEMVDGDVSAEVISTDFEGMIKEGETEAILEGSTDPILMDDEAMSEIFWLTKVLGNYNINKMGDSFIFDNNGQSMLLQRI